MVCSFTRSRGTFDRVSDRSPRHLPAQPGDVALIHQRSPDNAVLSGRNAQNEQHAVSKRLLGQGGGFQDLHQVFLSTSTPARSNSTMKSTAAA